MGSDHNVDDDRRGALSRRAKIALLEVAREAIFSMISRGTLPAFDLARFAEAVVPAVSRPGAAFVSLHIDGHLRGCIGTLYEEKPLFETVAEMAGAAATEDPRFSPMTARELARTEVEISVLTPFEPIAPDAIIVGRHGLYVAREARRGVLLPQVPVQFGWDREEYLAQACRKAGLPSDSWRDEKTLVLSFTAEVFNNVTVLDD